MPPTVIAVLLASVCLLMVNLFVCGRIWMQLRRLPPADIGRLLEELARQRRALDEALQRIATSSLTPSTGAPPATRTHRFDRAADSAVTGPTLIAVPNLAATPGAASAANEEELSRRFGSIWSLADEGAAPETIAERTGQPIGQVELVLRLRRQFAAQAAPDAVLRGPLPR